jgi:hypothetical protein
MHRRLVTHRLDHGGTESIGEFICCRSGRDDLVIPGDAARMAQLFGQAEPPMMISMLPPSEHVNAHGTIARQPRPREDCPPCLAERLVMTRIVDQWKLFAKLSAT